MWDDLTGTDARVRLSRMWLLAVLLTGACGSGASSGPSLREVRPALLPDGFAPGSAQRCRLGAADDPVGTLLTFQDTGSRETAPLSRPRNPPGRILVAVWDASRPLRAGEDPVGLGELLARAASGSVYDTTISGNPAKGYEVSLPGRTAPRLVLAWASGRHVVWVFGEQITALEMVQVAESIRDAPDAATATSPAGACPLAPDQIQAAAAGATPSTG